MATKIISRQVIDDIQFYIITHDTNGNSRAVIHYSNLLRASELMPSQATMRDLTHNEIDHYIRGMSETSYAYQLAVKRANKIGGRKYHTRLFGGGIVFQVNNLNDLARAIHNARAEIL